MKLLRCRKCGTFITTQDNLIEQMMEEVKRLNSLAEKDAKFNKGRLKSVYQQQSSQIFKLMRQIIHLTSQMDEESRLLQNKISVLVYYLRTNKLITDEKLHELEEKARKKVEEKNASDEAEIRMLYGEFNSICQNRTKADPTANAALKK